ncbi:conserved hypothetical protein [Desulfatibacillum aliphaticivorans]|uniref:Uncharacterized protein n=1 Tax=Desulfatibacillum aliphaticivorans TaxID=218208 RepID=B8FKS0_DESAL|nr:hypothetical protein [Desulfatibacillum aliphaticivorans]ACL04442.1 conserved hypothetical protein [Desulfatibacillum aliphaticivorans]
MKIVMVIMTLVSLLGLARAEEYAEGQIWSYKTRPGEEKSTVLINKIESHDILGHIFHISIREIKLKSAATASGFVTEITHSPVSEETLKKSLTKVVGKGAANSECIEGYYTWKEAFDNGEAGIFTVSVSEIVDLMEKTVN